MLTADKARQALELKNVRRPVAAVMSELGTSRSTLSLVRRMRSCESKLAQPPCIILAASLSGFPEPYDDMRQAGFSGVLASPPTFDGLKTRLSAAGLLPRGETRRVRAQRRQAESLFWRELEGDLSQLQSAIDRQDAAGAARWAHRIKGASLMFGKDNLGDAAARLEQHMTASQAPDMATAARMVEHLVALFLAHRGA